MTKATDMIAAERERQVTEEGYTAGHDKDHALELTQAAQCYVGAGIRAQHYAAHPLTVPFMWPWADRFWKPTGDPVRDLVKAGALIAAAIDSLVSEPTDYEEADRG